MLSSKGSWLTSLMPCAVASLMAIGAVSAAAQTAVVITTDKDTYIYPLDQDASVSATGLGACAGRDVAVGFFGDGGLPFGPTAIGQVDAQGAVTASIPVPPGAFAQYSVGVSNPSCLAGSPVLSPRKVNLLHSDPTQQKATPGPTEPTLTPPNTGSAPKAPKPSVPWAISGMAIGLSAVSLSLAAAHARLRTGRTH